jgi:hypothetical protein
MGRRSVQLASVTLSDTKIKLKPIYGDHMAFAAWWMSPFCGVNHLEQVWDDAASRSVYPHLTTTKERVQNNK